MNEACMKMHVSFLLHVKYTISYRIVSYRIVPPHPPPSGLTMIFSQEGCGVLVHEMRQKSQNFLYKYNKLTKNTTACGKCVV